MGKKGARRKTRWRALSLTSPPGEEDEEEEVRVNGYTVTSSSTIGNHDHPKSTIVSNGGYEKTNGYNGYGGQPHFTKGRRISTDSTTSGYVSNRGGSRSSFRDNNNSGGGREYRPIEIVTDTAGQKTASNNANSNDSGNNATEGLPPRQYHRNNYHRYQHHNNHNQHHQQSKIVLNGDEYSKITMPRHDGYYKKTYSSQRKPWTTTSTASTSATPSTTESQSASHSTADGSETTEDLQFLDSASSEYSTMEPPPTYGYGYYDHGTGYYYEYPMMVVGPAVSEHTVPSVLSSMPCNAVPNMRPVEWVNPAYVTKHPSHQYCLMDCQVASQGIDCATIVDAQGVPFETAPVSGYTVMENGYGESLTTGSISRTDSLIEEELPVSEYGLEPCPPEELLVPEEEIPISDATTYITTLPPQPLTTSHHVHPTVTAAHHHHAHPHGHQHPHQPVGCQTAGCQVAPPPPACQTGCSATCQSSYCYPGQYMYGPSMVNCNVVGCRDAKGFGRDHVYSCCCHTQRSHSCCCCVITAVPLQENRCDNTKWSDDQGQRGYEQYYGVGLCQTQEETKEEEAETTTYYYR